MLSVTRTGLSLFVSLLIFSIPVPGWTQDGKETNEAEKIFRKAEKQLVEARTLSWRSVSKVSHMDMELEVRFLLGEEGRTKININAGENSMEIVSDGKNIRNRSLGTSEPDDLPIRKVLPYAMMRMLSPIVMFSSGNPFTLESEDVTDHFQTSHYESLPEEKVDGHPTVVIRYRIVLKGEGKRVTCKLWLDKHNLRPIKREVEIGRKAPFRVEERFHGVKIDKVIMEKEFRLPVPGEKR